MSSSVTAVLWVVGSLALALSGLWIVRRLVSLERLAENNEVAGFAYSIIGVIYGVLVASVVVVVWERFNEADTRLNEEANQMGGIYQCAYGFSDSVRREIHRELHDYATFVVESELPGQAQQAEGLAAHRSYESLWRAILSITPQTPTEQQWLGQISDRMNRLADYHRLRILSTRSLVPPLMWALLIGGGVIVIAFSYLFGMRSTAVHMLIVGALATTICMLLFLIAALAEPFSGPLRVGGDVLVHLQYLMAPVR